MSEKLGCRELCFENTGTGSGIAFLCGIRAAQARAETEERL